MISGVFHNRLQKDIPLQSDPTVIYAVHEFDGNLRKKDLSIDSPYNTYLVVGLPPGPIANPGACRYSMRPSILNRPNISISSLVMTGATSSPPRLPNITGPSGNISCVNVAVPRKLRLPCLLNNASPPWD